MAAAVTVLPHARPLRGSRISAFYQPSTIQGPSLSSLESAFQLQEYIALLIRKNPHDVDAIVSIPEKMRASSDDGSEKDGKGELVIDEACWVYEHLRRLAQDLTHPLITSLQQECTRSTCPEMKAGEWLYLCVAHGSDGAMEQCCAIDYILHTLDSATALLNSPRTFPSRLSIPATSIRHFSSLARRLGRIFAHAYFHHREAFEQSEAESSLYTRFLALTSKFNLVPAEFLVIPPRIIPSHASSSREVEPPRLLAASVTPAHRQDRNEAASTEASGGDGYRRDGMSLDVDQGFCPDGPSPMSQGSPRKLGRNRTDTMIFTDAFSIGEELRHANDSSLEGNESSPKSAVGPGPIIPEPEEVPLSQQIHEDLGTFILPDTVELHNADNEVSTSDAAASSHGQVPQIEEGAPAEDGPKATQLVEFPKADEDAASEQPGNDVGSPSAVSEPTLEAPAEPEARSGPQLTEDVESLLPLARNTGPSGFVTLGEQYDLVVPPEAGQTTEKCSSQEYVGEPEIPLLDDDEHPWTDVTGSHDEGDEGPKFAKEAEVETASPANVPPVDEQAKADGGKDDAQSSSEKTVDLDGSTEHNGNRTLEEDLADVEKVLQE